MTYRLIIRPTAELDILNAEAWYDGQEEGLREQFLAELDRVAASVVAEPERFPFVYRRCRRALLGRFPYALYFITRGTDLLFAACVHQRRHPRVFRARVRAEFRGT